ncbi:hypothetical protein [Rhodococcus sp. HNM0569]|uniref:hypothetical protein n=1 Tax=Rhodococcus sp. HNM0569 TaxID=2716340 RepID=UPI00146C8DD2|nr:hypothetical protein [Rhodococcus sp. HNM0569]NLU83708.1 hypothetical protein [Rhodococcus sp. HNM0569]
MDAPHRARAVGPGAWAVTALEPVPPPAVFDVVERWNPRAARRLARGDGAVRLFVAGPPVPFTHELRRDLDAAGGRGVEVVDTAGRADVVVMALDGGSPLGREELSILDAAAPAPADVVFVLTRTEVHANWRDVAERDRALLAGHDARFEQVELHPLSTDSAVERVLAAVLACLPGSVDDVVDATRAAIERAARHVRADTDAAALRDERRGLVAGRGTGRSEHATALRSRVQIAKVRLLHDVGARARTLAATARAEIDGADRAELAGFPKRWNELVRDATVDVDAAATAGLAELGVTAAGSGRPPTEAEPPEPRHRGVEDKLTIAVGASAGFGLGRLAVSPLSLVPVLDLATMPVALALGASAAWWISRARGHLADRAHLRQWVGDSSAHARSEWEQAVLARLLEAEATLAGRVTNAAREQASSVSARVAEIDAELRRLESVRAGKLAACERDLHTLAAG